jgi:PIN domain
VSRPANLEGVVLDSSVLLGAHRGPLIAAAALGYYTGFWSSWIVAEFARKRTEWIAERTSRDACDRQETRRPLRDSRRRINAFIQYCAPVLRSVDYGDVPTHNLAWLQDLDDWPVMQTALAATADALVT